MLHNKRRKSKGENFFILLFLLQEMLHPWRHDYTTNKLVLLTM